MIRFSLLQFRAQAIVAVAGLVIAAIVLAVTGLQLAHLYDSSALATCLGTACTKSAASFQNRAVSYASLGRFLGFVVLGVPAVIGLFWGAPLVAREIETHTDRLAWTQGVTRSRWIAVKLAVVGVASMAVTGLLSLMITWWASPIDKASMYRWSAFDQRGIVPVAYAAFAFTLGVAAGAVIRRTLPAMAVALVVFIAAHRGGQTSLHPAAAGHASYQSRFRAGNRRDREWAPLHPARAARNRRCLDPVSISALLRHCSM
jgi:ABC-type transport system involved in multi-copper enzyme maturation permease subunit